MKFEDAHLSDRELVLAADGELAPRDAARAEAHLAACWECRTRKQEMETAIADFVHTHQETFKLPPTAGPRALLKARLEEVSNGAQPRPWGWGWILGAAAAGLVVLGMFLAWPSDRRSGARMVALAVPNPNLTPGATVLRSRGEVCRDSNTRDKAVPASLQRLVFEEYGIAYPEPRAYEVDYLITPALGGADDIHNLWPQSYSNTVWNARVKDSLEDHLRDLVCDGSLDLATAQRELAGNWIEAYKKYFRTDRPLNSR
jgi:hypothetical protein